MQPRTLALTFDDGPDPVWTARLLDVLERASVPATFFVVATRAVANPGVVGRMLATGHEVAFHCVDHVRHDRLSPKALARDLERGLELLGALGVDVRHWRPPWGVATPVTEELASAHGLQLVGWSCDSHDWRGDGAAAMFDSLVSSLEAGGIVLMHDGLGPGARRKDVRPTELLIEPLVRLTRACGLTPSLLGKGSMHSEMLIRRSSVLRATEAIS